MTISRSDQARTGVLTVALSYIVDERWAPVPIAHRQKQVFAGRMGNATDRRRGCPAIFQRRPPERRGHSRRRLARPDGYRPRLRRSGASGALHTAENTLLRAGMKPASHWLYFTDLAKSVEKADAVKDGRKARSRCLECRIGATGAQTVFPGSTHPSRRGDRVERGTPRKSRASTAPNSSNVASGSRLFPCWRGISRRRAAVMMQASSSAASSRNADLRMGRCSPMLFASRHLSRPDKKPRYRARRLRHDRRRQGGARRPVLA